MFSYALGVSPGTLKFLLHPVSCLVPGLCFLGSWVFLFGLWTFSCLACGVFILGLWAFLFGLSGFSFPAVGFFFLVFWFFVLVGLLCFLFWV